MSDYPCCENCGVRFDPEKWDFEPHQPGCPQSTKARTVSNNNAAMVARPKATDKKMLFLYHWQIIYPDLHRKDELQPVYDPEHKFAEEIGRGWLFDFAWVDCKVAVEVDGGNRLVRRDKNGIPRAVGRHTQDDDYWKINAAQSLGWIVLRYTTQMLKENPVECCEQVYKVLMMRLG